MQQFKTTLPILWFQKIGDVEADNPIDLPDNKTPIYQTILSKTGSNFTLDSNGFYYVDSQLNQHLGSLIASNNTTDIAPDSEKEVSKLLAAGHFIKVDTNISSISKQINPDKVFDTTGDNIIIQDSSLEFYDMVSATEELRSLCHDSDIWRPVYNDFANTRTISMSLIDLETLTSGLKIEIDPITKQASLTITNKNLKQDLLSLLKNTNTNISDKNPCVIENFDMEVLIDIQDAIKRVISTNPGILQSNFFIFGCNSAAFNN